jgi:hypothetical protein
VNYHNLFGIKGTGPAGSVTLPTTEYQDGRWVTVDARFAVYHNDAESISDHAQLLATSSDYSRAMADRAVPDAFANDLTGVYATDPHYGENLIALMKLYNLYRFDSATAAPAATANGSPAPSGQPGNGERSTAGDFRADIPGVATPTLAPTAPATGSTDGAAATAASGNAQIPGLVTPGPLAPSTTASRPATGATRSTTAVTTASVTTASVTTGRALIPGVTTPALAPSAPSGSTYGAAATADAGNAQIPGLVTPGPLAPGTTASRPATGAPRSASAVTTAAVTTRNRDTGTTRNTGTRNTGNARVPATGTAPYQVQLPGAVSTAFFASAKAPLARGEHLYRDVAACTGVAWELLAAVDWMECKADPRYSPVHGERLGAFNLDGTSYATKSQALTQCAGDLIELAGAVYGINLTARRRLSVRALAAAFAAFRWGAILTRYGVSAMEFPYSVAGLTAAHQKMHWPGIDAPDAPDRPGARFRAPFGALPVVLSLGYPATV